MPRNNAPQAVNLSARDLSHLTMIGEGALSPLTGFLKRADYRRVLKDKRLSDGTPWAIPITLAVSRETARRLRTGRRTALRTPGAEVAGVLELEEKYACDREADARLLFGTSSASHPGVAMFRRQGEVLLGGRTTLLLARPAYGELDPFWMPPEETRRFFRAKGWKTVAGFQTRNAPHRGHEFLMRSALEQADGLFLHPTAGETKDDDLPAARRFPCYQALLRRYLPRDRVLLALNPSPMHYAGPREALHHAIIRRNYGCTHFVVGRDHAGVNQHYGPYEAQKAFEQFRPGELGITPIFSEKILYCRACMDVTPDSACAHAEASRLEISGTRLRRALESGERRPAHLVRPEVWQALRAAR